MPGPSKFINNVDRASRLHTHIAASDPSEGMIKLAVSKGLITEERARKLTSTQLRMVIDSALARERKANGKRVFL